MMTEQIDERFLIEVGEWKIRKRRKLCIFANFIVSQFFNQINNCLSANKSADLENMNQHFSTFYHSIRCFAIWIWISERPWFEVIHYTHISNLKHLTKALRMKNRKHKPNRKQRRKIDMRDMSPFMDGCAGNGVDWLKDVNFSIYHFPSELVWVYCIHVRTPVPSQWFFRCRFFFSSFLMSFVVGKPLIPSSLLRFVRGGNSSGRFCFFPLSLSFPYTK